MSDNSLHRPHQWTGPHLWLRRLVRDPLSSYDKWCHECRRPWPCPTQRVASRSVASDERFVTLLQAPPTYSGLTARMEARDANRRAREFVVDPNRVSAVLPHGQFAALIIDGGRIVVAHAYDEVRGVIAESAKDVR